MIEAVIHMPVASQQLRAALFDMCELHLEVGRGIGSESGCATCLHVPQMRCLDRGTHSPRLLEIPMCGEAGRTRSTFEHHKRDIFYFGVVDTSL